MPKLKTHKGTAKRFKKTGSGKIQRRKAMVSHNRSKENTAQSIRRKRGRDLILNDENPRISELIPYK